MKRLGQLKLPLPFAAAGGVIVGSAGLILGYLSFAKPSDICSQNRIERISAFDRNASSYDSNVSIHEFLSGITSLRKSLLRDCVGDVLELAAGTGRNIGLYPHAPTVSSLTLLDMSIKMLAVAETKIGTPGGPIRIVAADASHLPFDNSQYDTVVDTFGLCSFDDPAAVLLEAARVLRPGGQLILLEHGRGDNGWLNGLLDRWADAHAQRHGCSWNRDVEALVREAAPLAGLNVEHVFRHHMGTTLVIRCKRDPKVSSTSLPL
jgi:methyltransferase OMS1